MDYHNMRLLWFESFQKHQDELEATNLLKLQAMEPQSRYYVEAKLDGKLEWTEWAYTRHERDQLVKDAKDAGFTCTVEEYE
tara:strand:+ start:1825 stop:2067 length:243 start_codon:yes stop_codon:yes gene_type:complete